MAERNKNDLTTRKEIQLKRIELLLEKDGSKSTFSGEDAFIGILEKLTDEELINLITRISPKEKQVAPAIDTPEQVPAHVEETFQRFNLSTRIQHGVMAISVIILIITGLPIKFHDASISIFLMNLMGGIEVSSFIHRLGATGLIFVGLFHLGYIALAHDGRRDFMLLLPRPKDLFDAIKMMKYYFGLSEQKAQFGRFSFIEKFDYWAVYWGMLIMISSGSLLWFKEQALTVLPKYVMDIATEAHSDEALLATLAIIIWHFYNVHLSPNKFPVSKVFIHGKMTRHEMEDEHPLELEEILKSRKKAEKEQGGK